MGHFSNGTEGLLYQEKYCFQCRYWDDDENREGVGNMGCPVWFLHELHVGEPDWQPTLDKLIPMVDGWSGECYTFCPREAPHAKRPVHSQS
jgi:hypothetical protein